MVIPVYSTSFLIELCVFQFRRLFAEKWPFRWLDFYDELCFYRLSIVCKLS
jgi:hypothetical protein